MQCELFRGTEKVVGPIPYRADDIRYTVLSLGGDARRVPPHLTGPVILGSLKILPVEIVRPDETPSLMWGTPNRTVLSDRVVYTYPLVARPNDEIRAALLAKLAAIHDDFDKDGRVAHRGIYLKADLEARINAKGALDKFQAGLMGATTWRGVAMEAGGAHKIPIQSLSQMRDVYDAIVRHVEIGFAVRELLEEKIKTLDLDSHTSYPVEEWWASTLQTVQDAF